jgi:ectoine hydroxylase-related dioxygenase (phytanoyl-CoA dioxygenase family)
MKSRIRTPFDRMPDGGIDRNVMHSAVDLFHRHGALWLESVFSPQFVQDLSEAYLKTYLSLGQDTLRKRYAMVGEDRYMITVKIKPPFNTPILYANPRLMPILHELLGPDLRISSFGSVVALPGAGAQSVHFDYPPLFESEETCVALPPHAITLVVPLVDLDQQTGSTALWEGSHKRVGARDQLQTLANEQSWQGCVVPLPKRGDVYLMDFRLIHAGTANQSDHPRPILYLVYSRPWFREDMNFDEQSPLQISQKQFLCVPKQHRDLFANARCDKR